MEKIVEESIASEIDTPEVRRNKELMSDFDNSGAIYQMGMKGLQQRWNAEKNGIKTKFSVFSLDQEGAGLSVPEPQILNKMFEEMTYEKALNFLQSFRNLMTTDKNNQNRLNLLNSLGRAGMWILDLALLRLEQWNHDHRALANQIALAVVEEPKKNEKRTRDSETQKKLVTHKERTQGLSSVRKLANKTNSTGQSKVLELA